MDEMKKMYSQAEFDAYVTMARAEGFRAGCEACADKVQKYGIAAKERAAGLTCLTTIAHLSDTCRELAARGETKRSDG